MNLRRFLAALAALGCVCVLAGSTATAAGEEIVVETAQLNPANPTQWIDYSVANTQAAWLINSVTCLKLLDYDEVTGALVPEAATAMPSVSADGLTYTFTVRAGQAFSGGPAEPVSAESFKRAIERATSPAMASSISPATPPARGIVAGIQGSSAFYAGTGPFSGIQASGNTLTIQLSARDATLPYRIAMPYFCATRADAPAGYTGAAPHSGGPYFVSFANASGTQPNLQHEVVLLRNTAYSGNRLRNLGTIRVVQHGSALTEDHVHAAPTGFTGGPGVSVVPNVTTGIQVMALNTSKAPFDTERMRQAAAHAVDRTALSATAGAGWQPTDQFVSPLLPGHADANVYSLSANPAAATSLLNGATPSVTLCHPSGVRADVAAAAETQLEAVGFQVTRVNPTQPPIGQSYFAYIADPANCHLAMLQMLPDFPDGSRILHNLFRSPTNPSFFSDSAFNGRFDAMVGLTPESARLAEVADIDRDMAESAASIAIGHDRRHDAFANRIGCRFFSQVHFGYALNRLCISVEQSPEPGGTASTGDEATSAAPLQTSVTVPSGGAVTITQGVSTTTAPPEYKLLEQRLDISAPTQSAANPLVFTFELDAGLLTAAGLTIEDVAVYRNGSPIGDCTTIETDDPATPDPCIASRTTQGDGDGEIVVRSSAASIWEFGERYDPGEAVAALQALPGSKARDALSKVRAGISKLNRTPPDRQGALGEFEGAVGDLEAAVKDRQLTSAQGAAVMNELAGTSRQIALAARQHALDRGGNAAKIADAERAIAAGDARWASGRLKDAVGRYKDAVSKAEGA
jgi:peptide/nickel transport system substrate-binding protein